jgi:hypothetical protein
LDLLIDAQNTAVDFDNTVLSGFDNRPGVKTEGDLQRFGQTWRTIHPGHANARAQCCRLHKQWVAKMPQGLLDNALFICPGTALHHNILKNGQTGGAKYSPRQRFVHPNCRRSDIATDIGNIHQLEEALEGPVLAMRTVHNRKSDIELRIRLIGMQRELSRVAAEEHAAMPCVEGRKDRNAPSDDRFDVGEILKVA